MPILFFMPNMDYRKRELPTNRGGTCGGDTMRTRVYYADTDAGGVVYYANYLRWLEMARADWLEQSGVSLIEYVRRGVIFAVRRVEIDYLASAALGDELEVTVEPSQVRRVRFSLRQDVLRVPESQKIASAQVVIACLTPEGKPRGIPQQLAEEMGRRIG